MAELLEGRRDQFVEEVSAGEGLSARKAEAAVDEAIDRWVWYAGWSDKIMQVQGSANPVAGPYFDFTIPEPTGVVAVLAPQDSSLLGLVSVVAPVIVSGNTCVVMASEKAPLPAVTLSEVLATSDVPGGVVNVLTGRVAEVAPWLASHMDVNAIDLVGADADAAGRARDRRRRQPQAGAPPDAGQLDPRARPEPDAGLPRDQDGLAPGRRLSARAGNRAGRAHAAVRHLGHAPPTRLGRRRRRLARLSRWG